MSANLLPLQTGSKVFHNIDWSPRSQLMVSASSDKFVRIWDTRQSGMAEQSGRLGLV